MQVAVAEPLVWRTVECVQRLDLRGAAAAAAGGERRVAAATDTPVAIALMAVADLTAFVRCGNVHHALCSCMSQSILHVRIGP